MEIILKPHELDNDHSDLDHFSRDGELERPTETVIKELQELVSQAVAQGLSSELEGNIAYLIRELEVHSEGIYHRLDDRRISQTIFDVIDDERLRSWGIVSRVISEYPRWKAFGPRKRFDGQWGADMEEDELGNCLGYSPTNPNH